jgi:hypothetical protein
MVFSHTLSTTAPTNDGDIDLATANYDVNNVSLLWNRYEIISDVDDFADEPGLPRQFMLSQNRPNPFNPSTTVEYAVPSRSHVTITVYNILGQNVRTLVDEDKQAGRYVVDWDGKDGDGRTAPTGIYLYQIRSGDFVQAKKMLMLK